MTPVADGPSRRFRVRALSDSGHHDRVVSEPTFEAAAVSYVEHLPELEDGRADVRVLVHDIDSGHEHIFLIHLDQGDAVSSR